MNIKAITAIALATLVASTSLAGAAGGIVIKNPQKPKDPVPHVDPNHHKPIYIPIDLPQPQYGPEKPSKPDIVIIPSEPIENKPIYIPIDIGGGQPDIPIIPMPIDANGNPAPDQTPILALACTVADPLGTSDHFWIVNAGNVALPVGLKVRYRVPATGDHGAFLLPRQIAVGTKLLIPNLLHDAPDGAPCKAEIIT